MVSLRAVSGHRCVRQTQPICTASLRPNFHDGHHSCTAVTYRTLTRLLSLLQAEEIRMETASQDSLDGSRFVATQQAIPPAVCCRMDTLLPLQIKILSSIIRKLGLLLQDETQFGYLCFGWAGRQEHACPAHANQGEPLQAVNSHFVLQSLLSCYPVLSALA